MAICEKNSLIINQINYDMKIFDNKHLKKMIKTDKKYIRELEKNINNLRKNESKKFKIEDLFKEKYNDMNVLYITLNKEEHFVSICRIYYKKKMGYINLVYTNPNYKTKCITCNYLKSMMYLLQDKITIYNLDVHVNNLEDIKCYEKVGFIIKEKTKTNYLMEYDFDKQTSPFIYKGAIIMDKYRPFI